jgi:hypothetical protein
MNFPMLESEIPSALIATVYDAAPDPDLWTVALEGIRDLVGGCAANFHWQDERDGVFHCVRIDMAYLESYCQAYTRRNLLWESTIRTHLKRLFEKLARTGKLTSSSSWLDPQFGFPNLNDRPLTAN